MVEVVDVLAQQPSRVAVTENDDMIQALAPDTADETLADGIRFRRARGCFEDINRVSRSVGQTYRHCHGSKTVVFPQTASHYATDERPRHHAVTV